MLSRGFEIKDFKNYEAYFKVMSFNVCKMFTSIPFKNHHTDRYLLKCFYNLQEKYDRGQKDFDYNTYWKLERFINSQLGGSKNE